MIAKAGVSLPTVLLRTLERNRLSCNHKTTEQGSEVKQLHDDNRFGCDDHEQTEP